MNTFSENPLFLFVDDLTNGSKNFATEGKIVELFDTGCDARNPGAPFEIAKEPDAVIQTRSSTQNNVPNVRKPFGYSLRQDRTLVKKNTSLAEQEDKRQNIGGTCESPNLGKPRALNAKVNDEVTIEGKEAGPNPDLKNENDAKSSECSKQVEVRPEQQKAKPNSSRTWMSSKYGENNQTVKSRSISSSVTKQHKVPEARSTICNTFEGRAKTNFIKSVPNPRTTSLKKTSNVTSEASLKNGVKKFVNRAVDKDSLSNCSRQLEMVKTSGAQSLSKTSYASRLPRSAGAAKFLPKGKPRSESPVLIGTGKEIGSKIALMKIVGGTDYELQDKILRDESTKMTSTAGFGKPKYRPDGGITLTVTKDESPMLISQGQNGDDAKEKLSTKNGDFDGKNTMKLSLSRSKIIASKVPIPRFGRNLVIGDKSVQRTGNSVKESQLDQVPDERKSKFNAKPSSKIEKTYIARCKDSESNLSASGRPATYTKKVAARPSAKCHNLIPRANGTKNTTTSLETKPRNSSIVPKLMDEFRIQEKKQNEVSRCSLRSPAGPSVSPKVKMETNNLNRKPFHTFGILSDELDQRLNRFSDRVQEVLSSELPILSKATESTGIGNRSVDRCEQSKSKVEVEGVSSSGVMAIDENDEEVELKTTFDETSATASRKSTAESSKSFLGSRKTKELKARRSPACPSTTESKVPRPLATKKIPRKEMTRNYPARTWPKKQESLTPREGSNNTLKIDPKTEAKPSTLPVKKSIENLAESKNVTKTSVNVEKDEDEDVIPIMNPALYNMHSFATHRQYRPRRNMETVVTPQENLHGEKLEPWIDGHEQAYLKGRAIGLKVASMARAAKEDLKREFIRSGLKSTTPISLPDKSREIVDIGVSLIEKVLAEKANKIHAPSVRGDQHLNYHDLDKDVNYWNSRQWFM